MGVSFEGANPKRKLEELDGLPSISSYFLGNDSSKWVRGVNDFKTLMYKNLYKQVDLKYYSYNDKIKYDFIIHKGGDIKDICMKYSGMDKLEISDSGELLIFSKAGDMKENIPLAYQDINGKKISFSDYQIAQDALLVNQS